MTDAIQAAAYRILEGTGTMDDAAAVSLAHLRMIKTRAGKADAVREALEHLVEACKYATFDNGVTAPDGRNEGDYWASDALDKARAALAGSAKVKP